MWLIERKLIGKIVKNGIKEKGINREGITEKRIIEGRENGCRDSRS